MRKNGSPAAVATADGVRSLDLAGSRINPVATPERRRLQGQQLVAPLRIVIAPTASGRKWRASLDGRILCEAAAPLVAAARLLIREGVDPASIIEMWHQHSNAWALRGELGAVAAVVLDGEKKPPQPAKNAPPVRSNDKTALQHEWEGSAQ
jgi:hypothetical protein